jgi:hypothetical protein
MRWGILLPLCLLAACIPKADPQPVPRPSGAISPAAIPDSGKLVRQCHSDLRRMGIQFRVLEDRVFGGGCTAIGAVQLLEVGTPVANLGAMTCPLARELAGWVRDAVQPAAEKYLDSPVQRIESMGTYSCRAVNGQAGGKLSEHGRANAVDIGAFVLADGRRITLLGDWSGKDEGARNFLRAVHQAGCRHFQIGLGPDANNFHRDHLHFDMGRGPYCR